MAQKKSGDGKDCPIQNFDGPYINGDEISPEPRDEPRQLGTSQGYDFAPCDPGPLFDNSDEMIY